MLYRARISMRPIALERLHQDSFVRLRCYIETAIAFTRGIKERETGVSHTQNAKIACIKVTMAFDCVMPCRCARMIPLA